MKYDGKQVYTDSQGQNFVFVATAPQVEQQPTGIIAYEPTAEEQATYQISKNACTLLAANAAMRGNARAVQNAMRMLRNDGRDVCVLPFGNERTGIKAQALVGQWNQQGQPPVEQIPVKQNRDGSWSATQSQEQSDDKLDKVLSAVSSLETKFTSLVKKNKLKL